MKNQRIYTYKKAGTIAYREGKMLSDIFYKVDVPGQDRPGWMRK